MEKENEHVQDEVVEQEEITTTDDGTENQDDDLVTLSKAEYSKLKRQSMAYQANKESKKPEEKVINNNQINDEVIEAKILKAQGIDDVMLGEMKALAKLRGKSLLDIQNDPILKAMKEVKEAEERSKQSKLPASRNSSTVKAQKTMQSAGLSAEEHKELWRASINK